MPTNLRTTRVHGGQGLQIARISRDLGASAGPPGLQDLWKVLQASSRQRPQACTPPNFQHSSELPAFKGLPVSSNLATSLHRWDQNSPPSRIRRLEETGGLKPDPKPNLLLVATGSRLDSLQAKSLEPGPTGLHGSKKQKRRQEREFFFWRKLRASSQPQIQTLCSSGRDRCN